MASARIGSTAQRCLAALGRRPLGKRRRRLGASAAALLGLVLHACGGGGEEDSGPEPLFPPDYAESFVEVRDCRQSGDHDLSRVRVLADPAALSTYQNRDGDFPEGAQLLKPEYDWEDTDCTGPIGRWTLMERLPAGSSPDTLDWVWQDVDAQRRIKSTDHARCINCHTACGNPPDGYLGTCTVP